MMRRNLALVFALAIGSLAVPSLAADEVVTAVDGSVTVKGQPLQAGKITFYLDDDQFVGSKVKDGKYKVRRVPVGEWRVVIERDGMPGRIATEKASEFPVEVKPGGNSFDFDMKK